MSQLAKSRTKTKQAPLVQTPQSPTVSNSYKPQHPVLSIPATVPAHRADQPTEPRPKKIDQFFGLFVYRNDLLVEIPSIDNRTLNDTRLQMQEKMCPEIKQLLNKLQNKLHLGSVWESVVIQDRPAHVFKIEIGVWEKAVAVLNIVKEYLASLSIPIIAMNLSWWGGAYKEVLLNTTKAYNRNEVLMKIFPRVDPE